MSWDGIASPVNSQPPSNGWDGVASVVSNIPTDAPQQQGQGTAHYLMDMANAPFSGLTDAFANTAIGAVQGGSALANKMGLMGDNTLSSVQKNINDLQDMRKEDMAQEYQGEPAAKGLNTAGNIAGNVAQFAMMPGVSSESAAIAYPANTIAGSLLSASQPVEKEQDRLANAIIGGGSGLAGRALGGMLSTQVTDPTKRAAMQTAEDFGIPVYRSQVAMDNPLAKAVASFEKEVPGSGVQGKIDSQVGSFNQAVNKTIGQTGEAVTPENMHVADEALGKIYDNMTSKYNLPVTPEFETKLLELNDTAKSLGDEGKEYALQSQVDNVMSRIKNGTIDGKVYQNIRSRIGGLLRGQNGSPELGQLQDLLDTHFQGQPGMAAEDQGVLETARSQWRNMLALEKPVANSPNTALGPANLQGAVKNVFGDYAYGGGSDLERLARLGNILKDGFPNSGTAARNQIYEGAKHILGPAIGVGVGGAEGYHEGGWGGAAAGAVGGLALNRALVTPYLYSQMSLAPSLAQRFSAPATHAMADYLMQNNGGK